MLEVAIPQIKVMQDFKFVQNLARTECTTSGGIDNIVHFFKPTRTVRPLRDVIRRGLYGRRHW